MILTLELGFSYGADLLWYKAADGLANIDPRDVLPDCPERKGLVRLTDLYDQGFNRDDPPSSLGVTPEIVRGLRNLEPALRKALRTAGYNLALDWSEIMLQSSDVEELDGNREGWVAEVKQRLDSAEFWLDEVANINRTLSATGTVLEFAKALSPFQRGYLISILSSDPRDDDGGDDLTVLFDHPVDRPEQRPTMPPPMHLSKLQEVLLVFPFTAVYREEIGE
jgi:hypothetical protein